MRWIALFLMLCLPMAGCSGVMVRGGSVADMQADAHSAQPIIDHYNSQALTPTDARAYLVASGPPWSKTYAATTGNLFAYLFDKNKTILANAAYYQQIANTAALAERSSQNAPKYTDIDAIYIAWREAQAFIAIDNARKGVK